MWDTITCLRQSGVSIDHENEFFTKDLYSQIGLKGVVYLSFDLSKSYVEAHDILYSKSLMFCMDYVQKCVLMELLFCIRRFG